MLRLQHIMGAYLSDGRLSLAMMAPGFLSVTLGIIDMVGIFLNILDGVLSSTRDSLSS
jgi:hypothetical protein